MTKQIDSFKDSGVSESLDVLGGKPLFPLAPLTIVTGHYGTGKTNFSINLALDAAAARREVALVDLDLVNPYFRSSDYCALLEQHGVHVIAPVYAGTTLDTPSVSGEIYSALSRVSREVLAALPGEKAVAPCVIIDVGGDEVGATALGRFARDIDVCDYRMLHVINYYRHLEHDPAPEKTLLQEVEASSHLVVSGIVNNSHLQAETTAATVIASLDYAAAVARLCDLPLVSTTIPRALANEDELSSALVSREIAAYPVDVYVKPPWAQ